MSKDSKVEPLDHTTKALMTVALEQYGDQVRGTIAEGLCAKARQIANEVQSGKIGRVPEK